MKTRKAKYVSVILAFCIVCIIMGVASIWYYRQLQSTIKNESQGYLQEIFERIGSNINKTIKENYAVLDTMRVYLENANVSTFGAIEPVVKAQQNYWNYKDIMLIDKSGKAYSIQGTEISLTGDVYLQEAVLNQTQSSSMSQVINGKESIVFAIPLNSMIIDGKEMAALVASYDAVSFDDILSMNSFQGQAYSHIIRKNGTIVVRSRSEASIEMGYNVLSTIKNTVLDDKEQYSKMISDFQENKTGQIGFTIDNVRNYMVYTAIDPEEWYLLTIVPVAVVNAKSDLMLNMTIVLIAAIITVFAALIAYMIYSFKQNKKRLENIAYVDDITQGNTFQKFSELADKYLLEDKETYAIIYTNISKFKVMNDQLGRETCNLILKTLYHYISTPLEEGECMGRISSDNFAILVKYKDEMTMIQRFKEWFEKAEEEIAQFHYDWNLPVVEFGIYIIEREDRISYSQMLDRAKMAIKDYSHLINNKMYYAIYNEAARAKILREKYLEDKMESALAKGHFQVYLQPKYKVSPEKIGGAEALARWVDPVDGMIYPDEFIPLFERNEFVVELDLWVFDQVCQCITNWQKQGIPLIKVSVNCSKVQLRNKKFLDKYVEIFNKYDLPQGIIEIELTESFVLEDDSDIANIVNSIHEAGFGCSMDDFGSGYSSLNLIQTIPVDTLKIDRIFFNDEGTDTSKMEAVVGSIISMAKSLNMETVAEGVEKNEHVEMLRKFRCDYIQGYVFAKPMPIQDFEKLLFKK